MGIYIYTQDTAITGYSSLITKEYVVCVWIWTDFGFWYKLLCFCMTVAVYYMCNLSSTGFLHGWAKDIHTDDATGGQVL